jgi:hypothetical protein
MDRNDMLRIMQESGALGELDINDEDFLGGHGREDSHVKVMELAYALGQSEIRAAIKPYAMPSGDADTMWNRLDEIRSLANGAQP